MSNRSATYNLYLNSNVKQQLQETEAAAMRMDAAFGNLNNTIGLFGGIYAAQRIIETGKEWVQGAADYEQAMLRIKNASNIGDGVKNQFFINKEIDDFKLKLDEGVEAYGKFLFRIKNAGLSNDVENNLYKNILTVSKVGGLTDSEEMAVITNVGKLMADGILMARPLRVLQQTHPQFLPFIAKAMGLKDNEKDIFDKALGGETEDETAMGKLNQLISSILTKLHIASKDLVINAMQQYADSVKGGLAGTLDLTTSHINELSVEWERFKNSLVLDQKPELVNFLHEVAGGIHWLTDHEGELITWGGRIADIVKLFIEWRVAILALEAPFKVLGFFRNEWGVLTGVLSKYGVEITSTTLLQDAQTEATLRQTAATEAQTFALYEEVEAFEAMNRVQFTQFVQDIFGTRNERQLGIGTKLLGAGEGGYKPNWVYGDGITDAEIVGTTTFGGSEAAIGTEVAEVTGALALLTNPITATALAVGALAVAIGVTIEKIQEHNKEVDKINEQNEKNEIYNNIVKGAIHDLYSEQLQKGSSGSDADFFAKRQREFGGTEFEAMAEARIGKDKTVMPHIKELYSDFLSSKKSVDMLNLFTGANLDEPQNRERFNWLLEFFDEEKAKFTSEDAGAKTGIHSKGKTDNATTKLKGNSIVNINLRIDRMIGMDHPTFAVKDLMTMQKVQEIAGVTMTKLITDAVNDSQHIGHRH